MNEQRNDHSDPAWSDWLPNQARALGLELVAQATDDVWLDRIIADLATTPAPVPLILTASLRRCFLRDADGAAALVIQQLQMGVAGTALSDHLAMLRRMQGQPTRALADFRQVLAVRPDQISVWVSLSALAYELGDIDESVASLHRLAALIGPDGPLSAHGDMLGLLWFTLGYRRSARIYDRTQLQEAADAYRRALAAGFDGRAIWLNLGLLLVELGEMTEARAMLAKLPPDHLLPHWPLWSSWPVLKPLLADA